MSTSYVMIENAGEVRIDQLTTFGASSAFGKVDKIGQFGSGAKHGVLALLRQGLQPVLYSGTTKVVFDTVPHESGEYNNVTIAVGNKKPRVSDYAAEFGQVDWSSVDMSMREFISNALDQVDNAAEITIAQVASPRAKAGTTRVFVPYTKEVGQYLDNLEEQFLHFTDSQNQKCIVKTEPGTPKVYRKGVFVCGVKTDIPSLFDYNLDDSSRIDECRNMSDYDAQHACAKLIACDKEALKAVFRTFKVPSRYWEHTLAYGLNYGGTHEMWQEAWEEVHGDGVPCDCSLVYDTLLQKGFSPVLVGDSWLAPLATHGIRVSDDCISTVEKRGHSLVAVPPIATSLFTKVWTELESLGTTNGVSLPRLLCFRAPMEAGATLHGYYEGNTVYLNITSGITFKCILEELGHHITGATDNSRDFQDWAFGILAEILQ